MQELLTGEGSARLRTGMFVVVVLLGAFLAVKTLGELQGLRYIGAGVMPANTITISGYGEVFGVADVAEFTFTVSSERATVAAAQEDATTRINALTDYLEGAGIAEADIKTVDYSVYPQYDWVQGACLPSGICPEGRQVLRGYQVRQTTSVKVRDTAVAGDLLSGVGSRGATEVSGLNFTFDDPDALDAQARAEAIADAEAKAKELARQLGVKIVRVVSFGENKSYPGIPTPYYRMEAGMGGADAVAQSAPAISVGQNKVISNVSVTYEIR
jgi:uncharacterized protein